MVKCFVIMPFKDLYSQYYSNILRPVISDLGFQVLRSDEIYNNRPIIEDIIEQIIKADVIVADVSDKNPNVNYELGFAHALRKQVIIISQKVEDIPFDYRHIRTIIYYPDEAKWEMKFAADLTKTILAIQNSEYEEVSSKALERFYENYSSRNLLGLERVFSSRQSMNIYLDKLWEGAVSELDIVAFGLKSFRDFRSNLVIEKVKAGMKVRILTIDPYSGFLKQREIDENLVEGSIKKTILDLIGWVNSINDATSGAQSVEIKFYNALPLDFYWRQDSHLFIGPYLQGIGSQQTITMQLAKESQIGAFYAKYFEGLWGNSFFSKLKTAEDLKDVFPDPILP